MISAQGKTVGGCISFDTLIKVCMIASTYSRAVSVAFCLISMIRGTNLRHNLKGKGYFSTGVFPEVSSSSTCSLESEKQAKKKILFLSSEIKGNSINNMRVHMQVY